MLGKIKKLHPDAVVGSCREQKYKLLISSRHVIFRASCWMTGPPKCVTV